MTRLQFPDGFMWGTATASYQIEGAWASDGRGMSIWDAFSHTPGKTFQGDTGDVADDHYHKYEEDVGLISSMAVRYYRLSLSWSRILPDGRYTGPQSVNQAGVDFYNRLIDCLLAAGITPVVTLYHWDLPLALQIEEDGWLGPSMPERFADYADVCFKLFGDRVRWWITLNEPWCSSVLGYDTRGVHAPGRTVAPETEVYRAMRHLLLAHVKAVQVYNTKYKESQAGVIGITLNCDWFEAKPSADAAVLERNQLAAERALLFVLGAFADPLYRGDWPQEVKERVGHRLPPFSEEERALFSAHPPQFFGLNHYSTQYAQEPISPEKTVPWPAPKESSKPLAGWWVDRGVEVSDNPKWLKTDMGWNVVPSGIRHVLTWIQKRYNPPGGIIITENGCAIKEPDVATAQADQQRVDFLRGYISQVHAAITAGVDCRGYFVWSLMDNFEWSFGYSKRFGLHYVDYDSPERTRTPKRSALWYEGVVRSNAVEAPEGHGEEGEEDSDEEADAAGTSTCSVQ
mmetsp:Transcript_13895/g.30001  ORF Transcript_13895/g.30001 Transcript_13895/m.30001 type:complete len:514 (-) Transcript_13895:589-2130(-)